MKPFSSLVFTLFFSMIKFKVISKNSCNKVKFMTLYQSLILVKNIFLVDVFFLSLFE
ncbi:hypothetical protein ACJX0J_035450, partial [Zea mays]